MRLLFVELLVALLVGRVRLVRAALSWTCSCGGLYACRGLERCSAIFPVL